GISQADYDSVNGEGSFAKLVIPGAEQAARPTVQFKETPRRDKPGYADLGYWNFVSLNGPERSRDESADALLRRMVGAIKTPTLRNLAYSYPYMHNGAYPTVEDAISEIIDLSELSKAGKVRSADPELPKITMTQSDARAVMAFLKTLNDDLDRQFHSRQ